MEYLKSYKDVAAILGVCVRTVQSLYYDGKLKGMKVGRQVRFTDGAIQEYIAGLQKDVSAA